MDIRQLRNNEFEDSMTLSEYAFNYKLPGLERERAEREFNPEQEWGVFEEGNLMAKLTLFPFTAYVQGQTQRIGGIGGVSTWPEYRRQGLVAKLLTHTLETMNTAGYTLSLLHPFLIPFYRKFGWEVYCEVKKYTIPVNKFPHKAEIQGRVVRDSTDIPILDRIYSLFAAKYNGTLERDEDRWEITLSKKGRHVGIFYSRNEDPEGYVLYQLDQRELVVDEFVYLNEDARQGLWTFLANHDSMVEKAVFDRVPADDILPFLLPDPRVSQEIHPYFMARIVNVQEFIEKLTFHNPDKKGSKHIISVEDEYAPWNHGCWEWEISGEGAATLRKLEGEQTDVDLTCDIGTLAVMLLGYKRPKEMDKVGKLTGNTDAKRWLDSIIPDAQTALFDFF